MPIDITPTSFRRLSERLELLEEADLFLVVMSLCDLGIMVTKSADGGFIFESSLTYAKRRVIEELHKAFKKKGS